MVKRKGFSHRRATKRSGAVAVEMAFVLPVLIFIVIGLCVAQLGSFRYHQVASLAHESARWASVHGKEYARRTNQPIADRDSVFENVIRPRSLGLNSEQLTFDLEWDSDFSSVTTTVRYRWMPEAFFVSQTLSCTAIALATY